MNKKEPLQNLALSTLLIIFFHLTFLQDCKKIVLYEKQNHSIKSMKHCIELLYCNVDFLNYSLSTRHQIKVTLCTAPVSKYNNSYSI